MALYDEALGMKVNWKSFDAGTAMSAAMASGDVQISVSQGVPPFVVATSAGQDLQIADIAVVYADNDNCVVKAELEIDKDSAKELEGKKVACRSAPRHITASSSRWNISASMSRPWKLSTWHPPMAPLRFAQGSLDMVCGWGGSLRRMMEHGNVLLTGAEKDEIGISVYDVTSVPASFAAESSDVLAKFLKVTADMNAKWLTDSDGNAAGDRQGCRHVRRRRRQRPCSRPFQFPTVEEQLSDKWLGGATQAFLKGVGDVFFKAAGLNIASRSTPMMARSTPALRRLRQM
jgi:taurine transport system substrate-binding protein